MAATASLLNDFTLTQDDGLAWYRSSDHAKRGFCKICGSPLFWQQDGAKQISITAGSLDDDSGLKLWGHIFTSEKGSYYTIPDDELQVEQKPDDFPVLKDEKT